MSESVDLDLAFMFTCPKCQTKNLVEAVPVEFSEEMTEDYGEHDADAGDDPSIIDVTAPESVICCLCGTEFGVETFEDD